MLVKDAEEKRRSRAWMLRMIMEEKEEAAIERLQYLNIRQAGLKKVYEEYIRLYNLHIKPIYGQVKEFTDNEFEVRDIEMFLQGQEEYHTRMNDGKTPGVTRFRYAGKSLVGKAPRKDPKILDREEQIMAKLKQLDPKLLAELLEKAGAK